TYFFSTFIRRSWRLFLKKASSVATVTDDARKSLNVNYPETRGKTNVVYHSFNDQIFRYKGNKNKRLRVTYLGRMEKYKGINTIIRLVGERPNIDFCFIGSGQEVSKIKELSYEFDNLEYAGYLKNKIEIADYLNATDVLIMPSIKIDGWEELFGIALIEAMACGCVPIATKHKGPVTILGNTVFKTHLFDEDCIEKGAIEIFDYLEDNHDYLTKLKEEAVKISRQYNMEAISKLWEGILSNERR
ncbi:TPA: glycosyltransferase family 4 protein, partial [Escherichia coli]|nr:glycosyltransferase family 4 protein [Escherichia coli]HAX1900432.1 glycosyltransferase family 4 protein [Escherichia coli]